jgi:hypothetical protein
MEAAVAVNWEYATSTYTDSSSSLERAFHPTWRDVPVADPLAEAIAAAGKEGNFVSESAKEAAKFLLRVLSAHPDPEITVDPSGEIALEWYKDRHHVAVLSVDDTHIRWAAMMGADNPVSGVQVFAGEIPEEALDAVKAAT